MYEAYFPYTTPRIIPSSSISGYDSLTLCVPKELFIHAFQKSSSSLSSIHQDFILMKCQAMSKHSRKESLTGWTRFLMA